MRRRRRERRDRAPEVGEHLERALERRQRRLAAVEQMCDPARDREADEHDRRVLLVRRRVRQLDETPVQMRARERPDAADDPDHVRIASGEVAACRARLA